MSRIPYLRYRKPTARQAASRSGQLFALRRRALAWLCALPEPPTGFACEVPVNGHGNRADVAAFWSQRARNGLLQPVRCIAVICALTRQECWAAGINGDSLMLELRDLRQKISHMEAEIRREEPQLKESTLFEEYADWNYGRSGNVAYHEAVRHRHVLEGKLFNGTRSERLLASGALDEVYVAVPEGTLLEGEGIGSCGLLEVPLDAHEPVRLLRAPGPCPEPPSPPRRMQLVQAVAASAAAYVRAGHGVAAAPAAAPPKKGKKRKK